MVFSLAATAGALIGGALAGYGQAAPASQAGPPGQYLAGYRETSPGYYVRETAPGYGAAAPAAAGGRGTMGGTVIARGRQMMMIQTPDGRRILVKTQKRRKAPQRRATGTKMDKLLELAVISSMFRK